MTKALIIVDLQNGFMNHKNYRGLSKRIEKYIKENDYDLCIFTKFINQKNSMYEQYLNYKNLQDKSSQDISIIIPKNSLIFEKHGYGLGKNDLEKIKSLNIKTIDICGLQTDACVYAICFQLWDNGIYPNILINYTETNPKRKNSAKEMLTSYFGRVDERI